MRESLEKKRKMKKMVVSGFRDVFISWGLKISGAYCANIRKMRDLDVKIRSALFSCDLMPSLCHTPAACGTERHLSLCLSMQHAGGVWHREENFNFFLNFLPVSFANSN